MELKVDAFTAERIGLPWLRAALAPAGEFGRRHDAAHGPYGPGDEKRAGAEIAAVAAAARALDPAGVAAVRAALREVPEPGAIVARARAGDALGDVDFYALGRFVDGVEAVRDAWEGIGGARDASPRGIEALGAALAPGRAAGGFYLADAFDAALAAARRVLVSAEAEVERGRELIAARLRESAGIDAAGDEFAVLRERYDGPFPTGVTIVRETPTYRIAEIRPPSAARDAALAHLAEHEERVRRDLAQRVAGHADAVAATAAALGALDRLSARVAFAQRWGGCVPELARGRIAFAEATFAPLAELLAEQGRRYTPVSLDLRGVAVLTGPNMGGKSSALAATGFLCACAALGAPPPARSASLPLLAAVTWLGGDGAGDTTRLLSAYGAEMLRARDLLAGASGDALVLADEFARTTGPREGRALLVAFLEALAARGVLGLAATHFDGVADAAGLVHLRIAGVRDAAFAARPARSGDAHDLDAALAAIDAAMDYRVVDAASGNAASDALALAELLGLDPGVVARARALHDAGP